MVASEHPSQDPQNVVSLRKSAPPEWGTQDPSYGPEKLYTKGTDGRGNSHEVRVRMPPTVVGQIQSMVEQRLIPEYKTSADFVRDAVIHRLKWLEENSLAENSDTARRMRGVVASAELQRLADEMRDADEQVDMAKQNLKAAHKTGNERMLRRAVEHCWDIAEGLEEPWKSRVEEEIREYQ